MPQTNVVKDFHEDTYYHVYNRTVGSYEVFNSPESQKLIYKIIDRYLGRMKHYDANGRQYPKLNSKVDLLAFCIMPNHFHLLLFNKKREGITDLMHRTMTAFNLVTNLKTGRKGTMFETTYKASPVINDQYLTHISRYIHLNPLDAGFDYKHYPHSSYQDYMYKTRYSWLKPESILGLFKSRAEYQDFLKDGVDYHRLRKSIKRINI